MNSPVLGGRGGFLWDRWVDASRRWILVQILEGKLCKRQDTLSPAVAIALAGVELGSGRALAPRTKLRGGCP